MASRCRCAVCGGQVYRGRDGRIVWHTRVVVGDNFGDKPKAEICSGSEGGRF